MAALLAIEATQINANKEATQMSTHGMGKQNVYILITYIHKMLIYTQ